MQKCPTVPPIHFQYFVNVLTTDQNGKIPTLHDVINNIKTSKTL